MDRVRVYVAGPISKGDLRNNVNLARAAGDRLLKAGFAPLVPHLSCYWAGDTPEVLPSGTKHEDWLGLDLPWVSVADALLRLPGESVGADQEVRRARERNIPVYYDMGELISNPPRPSGDARYLALLDELRALHLKKAADYGTDADPLANLRASSELGIPPWVGCMLRLRDKWSRVQAFVQKGKLTNEPIDDNLADMAAYCLLALRLYREDKERARPAAVGE